MKKTAIAIAVVLAGTATLAQAAPKDNTWYTGAKVGWSSYHDTGWYGIGDGYQNDGSTRNDQVGAGAYLGYQANPYLGFELGYDWLGRMAYKGDIYNGAFKAHVGQLTAKLSYPLTHDLDLYTRLGGAVWRADTKGGQAGVPASRVKYHDTGVSPLAAAGLEYALSKNVATRLDYQWISNVGDAHTIGTRPDNGMLSLGVAYRFGQDDVIVPPAPAPAPAPAVQTKRFTLKSDVLFNFNKSTLRPEGQQALDQLYSQLSNLDPKDGSVVVLGFTDRIGSDRYNQKLSEARARSVVDYLISKGIPADKISARGMGEADPVTGSTCNGIKKRAQLISCLAPDRRVEIEVTGVRDIVVK